MSTSDPTASQVEFNIQVDPGDIVSGLNDNDELILTFIVEMLEAAGSSELIERLVDRLTPPPETDVETLLKSGEL